jgi:hypothetical protein
VIGLRCLRFVVIRGLDPMGAKIGEIRHPATIFSSSSGLTRGSIEPQTTLKDGPVKPNHDEVHAPRDAILAPMGLDPGIVFTT